MEETAKERIQRLMKFYAVDTIEDLVLMQSRHINNLQRKLEPLRDTQPRSAREG